MLSEDIKTSDKCENSQIDVIQQYLQSALALETSQVFVSELILCSYFSHNYFLLQKQFSVSN